MKTYFVVLAGTGMEYKVRAKTRGQAITMVRNGKGKYIGGYLCTFHSDRAVVA